MVVKDLDELAFREALEEIAAQIAPTYGQASFVDGLFDKERAFFDDPEKFKAALCSRRAGKSHTAAGGLIEAALETSRVQCPYIALTRDSAKRIIWPIFQELKEKYYKNIELKESSLEVFLPNGSQIFCVGADQANFVNRLRGGKYKRAVIDESQSFRTSVLQELIDDVLDAALIDHNGDLWLLGTPGPVCSGFFYDLCQNPKGFSLHSWTVWDNPHVDAKPRLELTLRRKGWTKDHPTVQREWFGKWIHDPEALVYRFQRLKNVYQTLPKNYDWNFAIGIDYGWHDQTAFVVIAYSDRHPHVFVAFAKKYSQMIPSKICEYAHRLHKHFPNAQFVCDTGGLGKSITEEMRIRWGLPVQAAEKTEKMANIELLNGDLIEGKFLVHEKQEELMHEYETLTLDDKGKEDPNMPNHLCDGALYAYRYAKHYAYIKEKPPLSRDSDEYMDLQEEKEAMEGLRRRQNGGEDAWFEEYDNEYEPDDFI